MRAVVLFQYVAWTLYVLIFLFVCRQAFRRPTRVNLDTAAFFGASSLAIVIAVLPRVLRVAAPSWLPVLAGALIISLPYLLLRLVASYADVSRSLLWFAGSGLVLSIIALLVIGGRLPLWLTTALLVYYCLTIALVVWIFLQEARRVTGVTRRRLQAVALGTIFLGLDVLCAGRAAISPGASDVWIGFSSLLGMASGLGYFLGFATPTALRRAWQEPELRAFLGRATRLPRLPDIRDITSEMERGAASALGAPRASIQLWDPVRRTLRRPVDSSQSESRSDEASQFEDVGLEIRDGWWEQSPDFYPNGQAFREQRAIFVEDAALADAANAASYNRHGARAILAAPITAGKNPLGVLTVYAPRAPFFADSDLEVVQILADQAAVVLETRALIDERARVHAREEAIRMKEDFLSSAAHDLKSPLTGIIGHSQFLRRRLERRPTEPLVPEDLDRIIVEAQRLNGFIGELLDATRSERGELLNLRESVDLTELAREVCSRAWHPNPRLVVQADEPVVGNFDPIRLRQLLGNLVDNAVKFSPPGSEIVVRVWTEGYNARLAVSDHGIGIPPEDLPQLFQRFHRGRNVNDRQYAGLGLGLYICRGIVDAHEGKIWVETSLGKGSTVQVVLPLAPATKPPVLESTGMTAALPEAIEPNPGLATSPLATQFSLG